MEEEEASVDNAKDGDKEEYFLFVGAATEVPDIRWPPVTEMKGELENK